MSLHLPLAHVPGSTWKAITPEADLPLLPDTPHSNLPTQFSPLAEYTCAILRAALALVATSASFFNYYYNCRVVSAMVVFSWIPLDEILKKQVKMGTMNGR